MKKAAPGLEPETSVYNKDMGQDLLPQPLDAG
jgi:hypothetical protein